MTPKPLLSKGVKTIDLSVIIVNYNSTELLRKCLHSIYSNTADLVFEVIVVDNNSIKGDVRSISALFPEVALIVNDRNYGFALASNQAIREARGRYILLLNPDTEVRGNALYDLMRFMENNPEIGIAGGKIVKPDGSLEPAARRSIPTPGVAFFRLTGMSRIFPRSPIAARYNLTYLDPELEAEVGAVSGSFMMIRRQVFDSIGLLDEDFFLYGEDLDFCLRARSAGWKISYYPKAEILHYKGQSSKTRRLRSLYHFYRAMYLFHQKHFARGSIVLVNALVYMGIALLGSVAIAKELLSMLARGAIKFFKLNL